jgi:predicted methyltransferase
MDRRLSMPGALAELDKAMADRDADFAVLVVPTEEEVPSKLQGLREYNGDKLVVTQDDASLALEVGYRLARARVLMKRSDSQVDAGAVHDLVERALAAMEDVRRVKSRLSGARTNIDQAYEVVEQMAARVRGHLEEVDLLVRGEDDPPPEPPVDQMEL